LKSSSGFSDGNYNFVFLFFIAFRLLRFLLFFFSSRTYMFFFRFFFAVFIISGAISGSRKTFVCTKKFTSSCFNSFLRSIYYPVIVFFFSFFLFPFFFSPFLSELFCRDEILLLFSVQVWEDF